MAPDAILDSGVGLSARRSDSVLPVPLAMARSPLARGARLHAVDRQGSRARAGRGSPGWSRAGIMDRRFQLSFRASTINRF